METSPSSPAPSAEALPRPILAAAIYTVAAYSAVAPLLLSRIISSVQLALFAPALSLYGLLRHGGWFVGGATVVIVAGGMVAGATCPGRVGALARWSSAFALAVIVYVGALAMLQVADASV